MGAHIEAVVFRDSLSGPFGSCGMHAVRLALHRPCSRRPHLVLRRAFGVCCYWKNQHLPLGSVACSVLPETVLVPLLRRAPRSRAVAASPFSARAQPWGQLCAEQGDEGPDTCSSGLGLPVKWAEACTVCGFRPSLSSISSFLPSCLSLSLSVSPSFQNTQSTIFKGMTQEASGRSLCCVSPSPVLFQNIPFPPKGDPVAMGSPSPAPSSAPGGHASTFCLWICPTRTSVDARPGPWAHTGRGISRLASPTRHYVFRVCPRGRGCQSSVRFRG